MNKLLEYFLSFSRFHKQLVMLFLDVLMLSFALWLSFSLRLGEIYTFDRTGIWIFVIAPFVAIPVFIRLGLYRAILRYFGFKALWMIVKAVSLYAIIWSALIFISGAEGVPRSVTLINWLACILLIGGSRMFVRMFAGTEIKNPVGAKHKKNIVIYGAGNAGVQLATVLNYSKEYTPVAFVDDNKDIHNHTINALRVYSKQDLNKIILNLEVDEIFLALPSVTHAKRKIIIQSLEQYPVHVRTLPNMTEVADGKIKLEDVKEIELDDLLGRDPVLPDESLFDACIKDKNVMVTGAGGSIGSELCRQLLSSEPNILILFEQSELNLYLIEKELTNSILRNNSSVRIIPILGNITDAKRIFEVFNTYNINTIYHAAAYKHVPLVEHNMIEGLRVNTLGTSIVAEMAMDNNVDTFILISTDKAVRPTNVMGASKRFAELVLQGYATKPSNTKFSMVRFGNVLGSSGSVVPLFREQIKQGGPVTVTHPDIIRYFMTIPEAAQLVIQAGAMGTLGAGGDVFVLDMGEPVKINELALKMIRLMGFTVRDDSTPEGDIEIYYSGLRPGEKLYEELLVGENATGTSHPRIMRAEEELYSLDQIISYLNKLKLIIQSSDCVELLKLLKEVVKGYTTAEEIKDVIWKEKQLGNDIEAVVELKNYQDREES